MAQTRDYKAPTFGIRDTRTVEQGKVADADTRIRAPLQAGDEQWMDKMLVGMGNQAATVLNKMADVEFSNLYLEGAAKAGVIESEDELQGNPLTRDWKVAGYRDTMGKLALADNEASFIADLPKLREKGSEELQAYLSERRNKIMPALGSMSREARAAAAGQLLLQDRSATKQWTTEHTKFIIEQKSQAVHAQWGTSMRVLGNSQIQAATGQLKPEDFQEQLRTTSGTVVGSVWMDNSLPTPVKQQLTFEMLQSALANDSVALYDYITANAVPDGSGGMSTLNSRLSGEQQLRLANTYREAMSRTNDARSMFRMEQVANLEAQIDSNTYTGTYSELTGLLNPMVLNKSITGEKRGNIINKYLDKQLKNQNDSALGEALLRGDVSTIFNAGKSIKDGVDALEATMARRGVSPAQRLQTWLNVGVAGVDVGFKKAGEFLGVSLRQMVNSADGTVLPQHAQTFLTINAALRKAEANGQNNTRIQLLSGLGEDDRLFAEQIMRRVDTGASLDEAVQRAKDAQAKDEGLSPSMRAARASTVSTAVSKSIDAIEPRGLLETAWSHTKAIFSDSAATDLKLQPRSTMSDRDGWFSNSPTVQFYTEQVRQAVRLEADNTLMLRPSASAEEVMSVAKANVAARTISTEQGPLIMPRNVNLQTVFGVGPGNESAIGHAIDGMLKETVADSRWQLAFDQGRLHAQEFDKNGARVGNGMFINPADIRTRIQEDVSKQRKIADEQFGVGKTVKTDGIEVTYNGTNSAGVPASWMTGFRDNLVAHEGVRSKAYKDLSGNKDRKGNLIMTVGVGVSSHNKNFPQLGPDGTVTSSQASASFNGASNDAAVFGARAARSLGWNNEAGFKLMSELAYQSGTGFLQQENKTGERYREFAKAAQSGDVTAAQESFKRTAAWYYSRDPANPDKPTKRQQSYLKLIEQSIKG